MADREQPIAVVVNEETISLRETLTAAKWRKELQFLRDAAEDALIRQEAARRGIEVSGDAL